MVSKRYGILMGVITVLAGCKVGTGKALSIQSAYGKDNIVPLVIIGTGPAGLSAAIYGARANIYTIALSGNKPGGLLTETTEVENWPGNKSIQGPELMDDLLGHAKKAGAHVLDDVVKEVDFSSWPYRIYTENGLMFHALSVIIATGSNPRRLGIPGEDKYWGTGVSSCAVCDAPFFEEKEVVVIGGGDSAAEEAMQLARFAKSVTVLVRGAAMRAAGSMQTRLKGYSNITVRYNVGVKSVLGDDIRVTGIELYNTMNPSEEIETVSIDGVFLAIGHIPNTALFKDKVKTDDEGNIVVYGRSQATSLPGVFAAGDVADKVYRQAIVAAGSGVMAELDAERFLNEIGLSGITTKRLQPHFYQQERGSDEQSTTHDSLAEISTIDEFQELIDTHEGLIIFDFHDDHCPSCMSMLPVVNAVAKEFADRVRFIKVDIKQAPELVEKLVVHKVPCLLAYNQGNLVARYNETMTQDELQEFVQQLLGDSQ